MKPLSNALNKAGICQGIDFKRYDYLECSMSHTNLGSIFVMTTTYMVVSGDDFSKQYHEQIINTNNKKCNG